MAVDEFMVGVVAEPETVVVFMARAVAETETLLEYMAWGVAARETVTELCAVRAVAEPEDSSHERCKA